MLKELLHRYMYYIYYWLLSDEVGMNIHTNNVTQNVHKYKAYTQEDRHVIAVRHLGTPVC